MIWTIQIGLKHRYSVTALNLYYKYKILAHFYNIGYCEKRQFRLQGKERKSMHLIGYARIFLVTPLFQELLDQF